MQVSCRAVAGDSLNLFVVQQLLDATLIVVVIHDLI